MTACDDAQQHPCIVSPLYSTSISLFLNGHRQYVQYVLFNCNVVLLFLSRINTYICDVEEVVKFVHTLVLFTYGEQDNVGQGLNSEGVVPKKQHSSSRR